MVLKVCVTKRSYLIEVHVHMYFYVHIVCVTHSIKATYTT